jgi:hyperosmotically inducible periplasmic protein
MKLFKYRCANRPLTSGVAILALVSLMPLTSFGQDQSSPPASNSPDNSAQNKAQGTTSDQQKENTADRMTTKKVRQALIADKSLSTYAHNVKIVTQNGVVTLKGPVGSQEEKQEVASKAADVVGSPDKVSNQLTVKQ